MMEPRDLMDSQATKESLVFQVNEVPLVIH